MSESRRRGLMGATDELGQNGFVIGGGSSPSRIEAISKNEIALHSLQRNVKVKQPFISPISIQSGDVVRVELTQQSGGTLSGRYSCGLNSLYIAASKTVSSLEGLNGSVTATSDVAATAFEMVKESTGSPSWEPPIVFYFALFINDVQII